MNHDQLKELLPLEALGLLEGEEARALAAHLADGCDECAAELRAFRETLAAMALSTAGDAPADRIWERLARRLEGVATVATTGDRAGGRGAPITARRSELRRWRIGAAIAAGVALLMTVVADRSARQLVATRTAADARIAALDSELTARNQELTSLRDQLAMASQMTRAVLAPDFRVIKLQPMPAAPDAAGLIAMSASRGRCVFEVAGLPPPPPAKTYELWWIGSKSGPVRAALFNPGWHGGATVTPGMPPEGETILASAVTLEPAGGTDKPTGAMYLKGAP